ncbi:MAG TPA: type II secretion system F family protein [Terriglobales bacterium]
MEIVVAILAFIIVAVGIFLVFSFIDQRNAQARLLRDRLGNKQGIAGQSAEDMAIVRDETLSQIPAFDNLLRRSERVSNLQDLLEQANLKIRAGNILLLCGLSAVALGFVGYVISSPSMPVNQVILFVLLGVVLGGVLPYSYAAHKRNKRFQKFEELFPEAIDTLARAVRAGHAFTTALELIAAEVAEPVASEFRKLFEEQKFGLPVRDALLNLTTRVPLVDVKFFVTAVMLQRETGGNLAEILDNLSYVIRERFKILRQVRVYTAQGRLTMMLLMGLPPIIVVTMISISPGYIHPLFADPIGHILIVGGIVLQTIGYFVIRKIIRIQV